MSWIDRVIIGWKAVRQLGLKRPALLALYRFGLVSGHYRRLTRSMAKTPPGDWAAACEDSLFQPPATRSNDFKSIKDFYHRHPAEQERLLEAAAEICSGKVRLFGTEPVALKLEPEKPLCDWTAIELRHSAAGSLEGDIKFTWEPARFGWAIILGRVYLVTGDENYAGRFWEYCDYFLEHNPACLGPNWSSGQEVALRMMALVFAARTMGCSRHATQERRTRLTEALVQHAARIPPTLVYARAQDNNHLLSEAAGLYTAGCVLPAHPQAAHWRQQGWKWLHNALQTQIAPDGTYVQHSTNYHRLMLQVALWAKVVASRHGDAFPNLSLKRLEAATNWLANLVDPVCGQVPNLGSNDGALVFPFHCGGFNDFRPCIQAASLAFTAQPAFNPGMWDEESLWWNWAAGMDTQAEDKAPIDREKAGQTGSPHHILEGREIRASLRVIHYHGRPSHADQLHVEFWRRGENLAMDAGTFRYNAPPPWSNSLAQTSVHNTIQVDGADQMFRAGRFLWLDWAQARMETPAETGGKSIQAVHDGYRRFGVCHRRTLTMLDDFHWQVRDELFASNSQHEEHTAWLNWLLPDVPWKLDSAHLQVETGTGTAALTVSLEPLTSDIGGKIQQVQLIRAGKTLAGHSPAEPVFGWVSPTYSVLKPALSFRVECSGLLPLCLVTDWWFSGD